MERTLFHATSFGGFSNLQPGDEVTLVPGKQNAQGVGVYFSEGEPDVRASDSVFEGGLVAIFKVEICTDRSWYKSKGGMDRVKSRPKTWHSNNKDVRLSILSVIREDGHNTYLCKGTVV